MNARKASNCTAMYGWIYGGQGSHLSQAASVFTDADLTLGPSVGLLSQYIIQAVNRTDSYLAVWEGNWIGAVPVKI